MKILKALKSAVRAAGSIVPKPVRNVVKKATPILAPVYEAVVPGSVKQAIKTVAKVVRDIDRAEQAINMVDITFHASDGKGALIMPLDMNLLQSNAQRFVESIGACESAKGLDLIGHVFEAGDALSDIREQVKETPPEEWTPAVRELLDKYIGSEDTALIGDGPNVKLRINIPFIGAETVTDLLLMAFEKALRKGL